MRYVVFLVALTLATAADADQRGQRGRGGNRSHSNAPSPRAEALSRNIPPRVLLPAGSDPFPTDMRRRSFFPNRRPDGSHRPWWGQGGGSFFPSYGSGYYAGGGYFYQDAPAETAAAREPRVDASRITGVLRLEITPASGLQYYVDGMYFGSSSDLGTQFELNAGARRVEVRAIGYKPLVFDARLSPGETVTYRAAMEPEAQAPPVTRAAGNRVIYVIPGCYMGSSKPAATALPKGCDVRKLVTRGGA